MKRQKKIWEPRNGQVFWTQLRAFSSEWKKCTILQNVVCSFGRRGMFLDEADNDGNDKEKGKHTQTSGETRATKRICDNGQRSVVKD